MEQHKLDYFATPGPITDAGEFAGLFDGLPSEDDMQQLCKALQGLMLHVHWVKRYGVTLPEERVAQEPNLRTVTAQLETLLRLNDSLLSVVRPLEQRVLGTCRDYSTLLCSVLRHRGVPARARCGFGTYFWPGRYEDHWICEYWNDRQERWVQVDAQLDELQREVLGISFDPTDMPAGKFVLAGDAWQRCRRGEADPELFGIFDMHGLWFIRGNVMRELASLNKIETLPWDIWGLMQSDDDSGDPGVEDRRRLIDVVAAVTTSASTGLAELQALYENSELQWPGVAADTP